MKTALARVLPVLFFFVFTKFAAAGDFVSVVIQPPDTPTTITVPPDRFLIVRNFTQEPATPPTATTRGTVSVTTPFSATVLTATIVDQNATPGSLEVVNNVVIAGPATVMVTPGNTTCFITYRKGTD